MPRAPVRYAQRVPSIANEVRAMLDVSTYVRILHEAALTGYLPVYSVDGRPTGEFSQINPAQRMELMQYFVNKVIPDPPREIITNAPTSEVLARTPHAVTEMSTEQLLTLLHSEPVMAERV